MEEITIDVPWGHISCKWWGLKSIRPIVCIHGWQDNCQSFDPLIYQLPDHLSYLAVDLAGHGLSSPLPDGMVYSLEMHFYSLLLICDHFRWETTSLMSHSLGAVISFLYAAAFPNKCDMVICLDGLMPHSDEFKLIYRHFSKSLSKSAAADIRNREQMEPPSYTYDELLTKLTSGIFRKISAESAPYILQRAVLPSKMEPSKYYFSRDSRLKMSPLPMMSHDIAAMFARKIISPYCFMKSTKSFRSQQYYEELAQIVAIMNENPYFEMHPVEGDHHVHLNNPSAVSGFISTFIHKYRPKHGPSKL